MGLDISLVKSNKKFTAEGRGMSEINLKALDVSDAVKIVKGLENEDEAYVGEKAKPFVKKYKFNIAKLKKEFNAMFIFMLFETVGRDSQEYADGKDNNKKDIVKIAKHSLGNSFYRRNRGDFHGCTYNYEDRKTIYSAVFNNGLTVYGSNKARSLKYEESQLLKSLISFEQTDMEYDVFDFTEDTHRGSNYYLVMDVMGYNGDQFELTDKEQSFANLMSRYSFYNSNDPGQGPALFSHITGELMNKYTPEGETEQSDLGKAVKELVDNNYDMVCG